MTTHHIDMKGQRFGLLTVVAFAYHKKRIGQPTGGASAIAGERRPRSDRHLFRGKREAVAACGRRQDARGWRN